MDGPIEWRGDGSIDWGDIGWAAPTVGDKRLAHNLYGQLAADARDLVAAHKDDEDFDNAAVQSELDELVAAWVRTVHLRVGAGQLPAKVEEWPHWLVELRFAGAVLEHWGTHPFGLRTTSEGPTENAP